jgi:hypothetical protein
LNFGPNVLFWLSEIRPMLVLKLYQMLEKYGLTDAALIALIVVLKVIYKVYKV